MPVRPRPRPRRLGTSVLGAFADQPTIGRPTILVVVAYHAQSERRHAGHGAGSGKEVGRLIDVVPSGRRRHGVVSGGRGGILGDHQQADSPSVRSGHVHDDQVPGSGPPTTVNSHDPRRQRPAAIGRCALTVTLKAIAPYLAGAIRTQPPPRTPSSRFPRVTSIDNFLVSRRGQAAALAWRSAGLSGRDRHRSSGAPANSPSCPGPLHRAPPTVPDASVWGGHPAWLRRAG